MKNQVQSPTDLKKANNTLPHHNLGFDCQDSLQICQDISKSLITECEEVLLHKRLELIRLPYASAHSIISGRF